MRAKLPDWMMSEFTVVPSPGTTAIVRNDFVEPFEQHCLRDCTRSPLHSVPGTDSPPRSAARIPGGRGVVRVVSAGPLGEAIVRLYRRGGWVEQFNERRYFLGNRAFTELVTTHRLRRRGAPVPEVLAAVQVEMRPGYEACLVTRRIPKTHSAASILAEASATRTPLVLESMGRAIRLLHLAGGIHPDLNAHNVLIPEEGEGPATVIDFDRGSVLAGPVGERRARASLRRLQRSFRKLRLDVALAEWEALMRAYEATPEPPTAA